MTSLSKTFHRPTVTCRRSDNDNQIYNNLNLNANRVYNKMEENYSKTNSWNSKKYDLNSTHEKESLQCLSKFSQLEHRDKNDYEFTNNIIRDFDSSKKEKSGYQSSSAGKSTLLLHLAAYDNNVSSNNQNSDKKFPLKKQFMKVLKKNCKMSKYEAYEFARQQEESIDLPEIMQFKTSQKLMNPNNLASKDIPDNQMAYIFGSKSFIDDVPADFPATTNAEVFKDSSFNLPEVDENVFDYDGSFSDDELSESGVSHYSNSDGELSDIPESMFITETPIKVGNEVVPSSFTPPAYPILEGGSESNNEFSAAGSEKNVAELCNQKSSDDVIHSSDHNENVNAGYDDYTLKNDLAEICVGSVQALSGTPKFEKYGLKLKTGPTQSVAKENAFVTMRANAFGYSRAQYAEIMNRKLNFNLPQNVPETPPNYWNLDISKAEGDQHKTEDVLVLKKRKKYKLG